MYLALVAIDSRPIADDWGFLGASAHLSFGGYLAHYWNTASDRYSSFALILVFVRLFGDDAVVPVEATDAGTETVRIDQPARAGAYVRRAGEDVQASERVLTAGTVLGAAQLGLLAALGETVVAVSAPLRVAVLSTGSELVAPGQPL